jgi:hypothetical protein
MQRDGMLGLVVLVAASLLLLFKLGIVVFVALGMTLAYLLHVGLKRLGRLGDRIRFPLLLVSTVWSIHRLFEMHQ